MTTGDKKPKPKPKKPRRSRKTPVAGSPEAAPDPVAIVTAAADAAARAAAEAAVAATNAAVAAAAAAAAADAAAADAAAPGAPPPIQLDDDAAAPAALGEPIATSEPPAIETPAIDPEGPPEAPVARSARIDPVGRTERLGEPPAADGSRVTVVDPSAAGASEPPAAALAAADPTSTRPRGEPVAAEATRARSPSRPPPAVDPGAAVATPPSEPPTPERAPADLVRSSEPPATTELPRARAPSEPPATTELPRARAPSEPPATTELARAPSEPPATTELARARAPSEPPVDDATRVRRPTEPPAPAAALVAELASAAAAAAADAATAADAAAVAAATAASAVTAAEAVRATALDAARVATALDAGDSTPYTDPAAATMPEPELIAAAVPHEPLALDPAAAAFEAARIAEKIVGDIDSASGAAIVAAAAAGAAIEAVRARGGRGEALQTDDGSATDPVVTVRMQRDRILRALAEDVAANAVAQDAAAPAAELRPAPPAPIRAPSHPGQPGAPPGEPAEDIDDIAKDPVQIAAAAIQRLRARASTDFAELRTHYHRHDIAVLVIALVIIVVAGRVHHALVTPPTVTFAERGLTFEHSQAWLAPERLAPWPPRLMRDPTGQLPKADTVYHVAFTSTIDPSAQIEVLIDKKPAWSNIVTGLELDRRTRWGELYTLDHSAIRSIEDQDWLRTAYRYAHAPDKGDVPRVDHAIEYATIDRDQIYVVTLFGSPSELSRMEDVVAPTLRASSPNAGAGSPMRSALPLVPQTRSLGQRTFPNPVARAFDSTVMVVVADMVDGRLRARGGGSGVIVGADGSILTNYHVIHDKDGRLHDIFVIGRFSTLDRAPQLQCAGRPNRSKLQRELDLALIKCDTDLDGRTWVPASTGVWATLPEARTGDVKMGQRLWVLGYPDAGGGGLTLSEGEVEGWTGQDGAAGKDFIKTDASITHGNSGGPVVDDHGQLVGIASASRTKITVSGTVIEIAQVGSVRPLPSASDLLAIATAGWTPREGHTDVELQPSAVEAPAEGIRIATRIVDAANEAPVRDALVMVLRPGVQSSAVDVNRLDDQVLSWGRSNTQGDVQLKQPVPVPGTYTVMVVARGYEPLIGQDALRLDDKTPPVFGPRGEIRLRSR